MASPSVLVVDDDHDIREALASILREEGFAVREACDGMEALEQIAADEPDVMLLDLMMPVMNGWEVMRSLRRANRALPVIVLSAVPAQGCADYIQKPVSLDRLLELLDTVRARSRHGARSPAGA
jgi:two-component system response regulator MprA